MTGVKEFEGKLPYELDWRYIEAMARRMQANKGKYEPYNWKKPMSVENLKQALMRHVVEVMEGNYNDTEELDHLTAISCNAMMIWYQLKNNNVRNPHKFPIIASMSTDKNENSYYWVKGVPYVVSPWAGDHNDGFICAYYYPETLECAVDYTRKFNFTNINTADFKAEYKGEKTNPYL